MLQFEAKLAESGLSQDELSARLERSTSAWLHIPDDPTAKEILCQVTSYAKIPGGIDQKLIALLSGISGSITN